MPLIRCALPAVLVGACFALGCMSWSPGWETPIRTAVTAAAGDPQALFAAAGDGPALAAAQRAFEAQIRVQPDNYAALIGLSEVHILRGAAYSASRRDKAEAYRAGIRAAEAAMATHPGFKQRIEAGAGLSEAVEELERGQMKAMLLWVTGVSYYFKECLSGLGHLVNFRWMLRTRETMEHMLDVAPDYEHGAVYFSLGIYYLGLPPSAGGDLERSQELIDRAVATAGGDHLLPRWGRAKYLAVATGNREQAEADLAWVLAQDPHAVASPYPWNVYMQRDAAEMLDRIDELVPRRR